MKGYSGPPKGRVLGYSLIFFLLLSTINCTLNPSFAAEEATLSAQEVNIGYSKIHPASPFYFLKAIRENLELRFAQTPRVKLLRQLEFATRRLREVRTLIGKDEDLIPPTLERYSAHISSLTDKHQSKDDFNIVSSNLTNHLNILQQIYNKTSSLRAKMFIRSAMNKLIQRADVSDDDKALICNLFTKEASSSALNQTEQFVLLERAQQCRKIN